LSLSLRKRSAADYVALLFQPSRRSCVRLWVWDCELVYIGCLSVPRSRHLTSSHDEHVLHSIHVSHIGYSDVEQLWAAYVTALPVSTTIDPDVSRWPYLSIIRQRHSSLWRHPLALLVTAPPRYVAFRLLLLHVIGHSARTRPTIRLLFSLHVISPSSAHMFSPVHRQVSSIQWGADPGRALKAQVPDFFTFGALSGPSECLLLRIEGTVGAEKAAPRHIRGAQGAERV